ncbi:MAG: glycosyl hydrolase, glucoamylase [Planctomycetota bacterium]|nr:glycosyl hydrolase, glucoamylase [Planctomycetota bacterium]
MVATWIEASAKGRHGGAVRAGMWSVVVIGTHPIESEQEVWLELSADDAVIGPLPAYWLENNGINSFWHVPIPPQAVGARLRYRSVARKDSTEPVYSPSQDVLVRPNLPDPTETAGVAIEGLVGNRMMTARVDSRGATYDVYFPTVGLHSDVRPSEGDLPQSRSHFRTIVGGLAVGRRLDWFVERLPWEVFQRYQGATNLLVTELKWRHGPIRVLSTDFIATGPDLPRTKGGSESPGQYIKRFRVTNEGAESRQALFGVYVQAEVNGGIGEPGLFWHDGNRSLLATNRGHGHSNRKLARDATVEFALALDGRGETQCEPTGPNEALLLRPIEIPAGDSVTIDLLVSGAFTGWRGDQGTFEHWLRPALAWFRAANLDAVEQEAAAYWDDFVEPLPTLNYPRPAYAVSLRRSALASALHADAKWGAIAAGFDRGLNAYCWPRDAMWAGDAISRAGHAEIGKGVYEWLSRVRGHSRPFAYWFQKYTIDGWPEWETPAADQTAMIPWSLERHFHRTGDTDFLAASWPVIEQAAAVCLGDSGHPGLRRLEDLDLISSASIWDNRFGAFLYSNACVVAGLRSSSRLAELMNQDEAATRWRDAADRMWDAGVLHGLVDESTGRFLEARRLSTRRGLWADHPEAWVERSAAVDISLLGPVVPFGLISAADPRMRRSAEAILRYNAAGGDPNALTCWSADPSRPDSRDAPSEAHQHDASSLATLWMARYLIALGRETGEGRHSNRALAMLDDVLGRLGPLGLALKGQIGGDGPSEAPRPAPGVWGLHAMLIDTMLDLAGFDYDAAEERLNLSTALPPAWPQIGLSSQFRCGEASFRLERPVGGVTHRLTLETNLHRPTIFQAVLACPGLPDLGPWLAQPASPPPSFDRATRRLSWSVELPAGASKREWTWG